MRDLFEIDLKDLLTSGVVGGRDVNGLIDATRSHESLVNDVGSVCSGKEQNRLERLNSVELGIKKERIAL